MAKQDKINPDQAYYYNLKTGTVEFGLVSDWNERIGPYATHDEAAKALERVKDRNEAWEEQDREWNGGSSDEPR